tara:strand:+ start:725 stop:1114 length:390 start_codon:yes stop_codon:yes gene_type:complete
MANREDNLKPQWTKGTSGNPKGRPKGSRNRSTIAKYWLGIEQKLKNPLTGEVEALSQEDLMTLAQIKKARDGDTSAYRSLQDSAYGSPVQQIEETQTRRMDLSHLKADDIKNILQGETPQDGPDPEHKK